MYDQYFEHLLAALETSYLVNLLAANQIISRENTSKT